MTCMTCGGKSKGARENYRYNATGLPGVTLMNVKVSRCSVCGEHEVAILTSRQFSIPAIRFVPILFERYLPAGVSPTAGDRNVTSMGIRDGENEIVFAHEIMLATRVASHKTQLPQRREKLASPDRAPRGHQTAFRTRTCWPPRAGTTRP